MNVTQRTERRSETEEQEPKGKRRLFLGLGIAAACLALALSACAAEPEAPDPGTESVPLESEEPEPDTEAPKLLGAKDITVLIGETISYRDGVSAVDDVDGALPFQVDAAAVDLTVPGVYEVVYSAKDAAGNEARAAITVTVEEPLTVDPDIEEPEEPDSSGAGSGSTSSGGGTITAAQATEEEVNRLADQILGRIIRDSMSQREKARAIYNYVYHHISYTGSSDKSSWLIGAYTGFTRQRGDCYNYFACSKALLTRAGIPNIDLERVGGTTHHYWQLVNVGDGWYHFDACWKPTGYPLNGFLLTEAQARAYTERLNNAGVRKNYYVYDYDSCPVQVVGTPEDELSPAVTQPPVETQEPPVVTDEPPVVTDEPPAVTDDPPAVTDEPPVVTDEPPVDPLEPPAETAGPLVPPLPGEAEPPVEPPVETAGPLVPLPPDWPAQTEPADDWVNWPGGA